MLKYQNCSFGSKTKPSSAQVAKCKVHFLEDGVDRWVKFFGGYATQVSVWLKLTQQSKLYLKIVLARIAWPKLRIRSGQAVPRTERLVNSLSGGQKHAISQSKPEKSKQTKNNFVFPSLSRFPRRFD